MKNAFIFLGILCLTVSHLFASHRHSQTETSVGNFYLSNDLSVMVNNQELTLRAGTPVMVEISQNYGGTNLAVGQTVSVRVKFGVVIEKQTVIAAGALGTAVISRFEKARSFGRPGVMEVQVQGVQTVDGQNVLLSGIPLTVEGENRKGLAWGLAIGVGLFTGGIGAVTGFFIKGKPAEIRGGTTVNATVASDIEVEVEASKKRIK
ncbi:MAG: hypothetical protein U0X91_11245 [Spirosomataceae bacterium]